MNARTLELLKLLSNSKPYTIRDLSSEFDVSERFIRYMIDDCDYYLRSINLPPIIFTYDGVTLKLTEREKKDLLRQINNIDLFSYDVSAKERQTYIILSFLCCTEPIKASFFSELLNVSKSSVEKDLTCIKQKLEENNLEIKNIQGRGLYLDGEEINVRRELLQLISKNFDFSKLISEKSLEMHGFIERNVYSFLFEIYINKVIKIVNDIEKEAKLKLSFLSYKDLCIYIIVMINRISLGKTIKLFDNHILQVKEMRTYQEAYDLCERISEEFNIKISNYECSYLCLILESSHFTANSEIAVKEWAIVQMYSNQLIDDISKKLNIDLTNDKELVNSLTLHIGLSFFKIQNNVPILNAEVENIKKMYANVYNCIKTLVCTTNIDLLKKFSDDDIAYLTLHIQAAIERNKKEERLFNIIVVCVHGYGTASLMKELIISKYKNIIVKKIVTSNSLENEELESIDFIVSSVDLNETRCPIIRVDAILKKHDYLAIEEMMEKIGCSPSYKNNDSIDDILSIISENSHINDFEKLKNDIENYLNSMGISNRSKVSNSLSKYLTKENIKIVNDVTDWKEAVKIAGNMLIKTNGIEKEYVSSVIDTVDTNGKYMLIDKGIALIHGEIDYYVNKTCMSLLLIKNGINFNNDKKKNPIHLLLCLAAKDNYTHNKALNDFLEIINDFKINKNKYFNDEYIIRKIEEVSK